MNRKLITNIQKRCNICNQEVFVNSLGHGDCRYCGWRQDRDDGEQPDMVIPPNMVSFNRAKRLIKEGTSLKPTLDDFIKAYDFYGEMELWYQGRMHGLVSDQRDGIVFYEGHVVDSEQLFNSVNEFRENAHIDGYLLKEIWDEIDNAYYMST